MTLVRQLAMSSRELWRAVEGAREAGACAVQRAVRVRMESTEWQAEELDACTGEWRALGAARGALPRSIHRCTSVGSLVYVFGGWIEVEDK